MNHFPESASRPGLFTFAFLIVALLVLSSCSQVISEQDATIIAKNVISGQTKFYTRTPGNDTKSITNVTITSQSAFVQDNTWNVVLHIQGIDDEGIMRQNDAVVLVSQKGEVIGIGTGKVNK